MMESQVYIELPYRCLVPDNAKYGVIRGRMLLTARYRAAKTEIHTRALVVMRSARREPFPRDRALRVQVELIPPDKRRRDTLNVAKLLFDALTGAVYEDDAQIVRAEMIRSAPDKANPRCRVWCWIHTPTPLASDTEAAA